MKKISQHDEREIKDYVKHNPTSLASHSKAKSKALEGAKKETKKEYTKRHHSDLLKYETN